MESKYEINQGVRNPTETWYEITRVLSKMEGIR